MPRTHSPAETRALAAALAARLRPGDTIVLTGDLGAGKTTFVQGLASGLGITERVQSPTFVLVRRYEAPLPLVHVDLYRVETGAELLEMGLDDLLAEDAVVAIEWGTAAGRLLPSDRLEIRLEPVPGDTTKRDVTIAGAGRLAGLAASL
jgi:tRNA threonylcarbamoyladenosine biosynthesis protein TsaE